MVEVFKTNVVKKKDASSIILKLKHILPSSSINIDLEDCDKVLRIESPNQLINEREVIDLLNHSNFYCQILD